MKQLLFIIFFALMSFFAKAQSATTTLDETGTKIIGGDSTTAKIVSISWTVQGTPPASVAFTTPTAIKTDITVTKAGDYYILFTVKDNLGNVASTVWTITVYDKQQIIIDSSRSHIVKLTLN